MARATIQMFLVPALLALAACGTEALVPSALEIEVEPAVVQFPRTFLGYPTVQKVLVRNSARAPAHVTLSLPAPFSVEAGEWDLASAAAITVPVTFSPTGAGEVEASLRVTYEDRQVVVVLHGLAVAPPTCAAPQPCHGTFFDPLAGACVDTLLADGTACALEDRCLTRTACLAGACVGAPVSCDDDNVCTRDSCDPGSGCLHEDLSAQCEAPAQPCKVAVCDPSSGCGVADAEDGSVCGPADCKTAEVCLLGGCRTVPVPEGTMCFPATPCQGKGVCRNEVCERPEPGAMTAAWTYAPEESLKVQFPGTVDDKGHLYLLEGSKDRGVFTSLTKDGYVRFRQPLEGVWSWYGATLALDPTRAVAYLTDGKSLLAQHHTADGKRVWARDVANDITAEELGWYEPHYSVQWVAPQAKSDVLLVSLVAGDSNHLSFVVALDAKTGAVRWKYHRPGHFYGLVTDGSGTTYLSVYGCWASSGDLVALERDGQVRWSTGEGGHPIALAGDGRVLVYRNSGLVEVDALTPESPLELKNAVSPYDDMLTSPRDLFLWSRDLVGSGQRVALRSLEAATGVERWSVSIPDLPAGNTSLLTSRNTVLTVTYVPGAGLGQTLREFGGGTEVFACSLPEPLTGATALTGGRWIGNLGGRLQAFDAPFLEVARSGWVAPRGSQSRAQQPR